MQLLSEGENNVAVCKFDKPVLYILQIVDSDIILRRSCIGAIFERRSDKRNVFTEELI